MHSSSVSRAMRSVSFALTVCLATVGATLYLRFGAGIPTCGICAEEVVPWYAAIAILACVVATSRTEAVARLMGPALLVVSACFAVGAYVGLRHLGAEQGLWTAGPACEGSHVPCDVPAVQILGMSLAAWNVLLSLAMAGSALLDYRRFRRDRVAEAQVTMVALTASSRTP